MTSEEWNISPNENRKKPLNFTESFAYFTMPYSMLLLNPNETEIQFKVKFNWNYSMLITSTWIWSNRISKNCSKITFQIW